MTNQSKPGSAGLNVFLETHYLKDLDRIDAEPMEFEWKIFPGFTTVGILHEIQMTMTKSKCEPEQVKGRIICTLMFDDIVWVAEGNDEISEKYNSKTIKQYARRFPRGHVSFLGPEI